MRDDDQKPCATDHINPGNAFWPRRDGRLERGVFEAERLDSDIAAAESEIYTTGRPERVVELTRKLEILKAKRKALNGL
jgi:hypothetical protein